MWQEKESHTEEQENLTETAIQEKRQQRTNAIMQTNLQTSKE
jgi:hypothetical protein